MHDVACEEGIQPRVEVREVADKVKAFDQVPGTSGIQPRTHRL